MGLRRMSLHTLTSPIFVDLPRWSHEILGILVLLYTYLVLFLLMLSKIYLTKLILKRPMGEVWDEHH